MPWVLAGDYWNLFNLIDSRCSVSWASVCPCTQHIKDTNMIPGNTGCKVSSTLQSKTGLHKWNQQRSQVTDCSSHNKLSDRENTVYEGCVDMRNCTMQKCLYSGISFLTASPFVSPMEHRPLQGIEPRTQPTVTEMCRGFSGGCVCNFYKWSHKLFTNFLEFRN